MGSQPHRSKRILVIGDSCDDIYHFGTCRRKNPESPAPLLMVERTELRGGMAMNVVSNALSLGMEVNVLTNETKPRKERFFDASYSYQLLRVDSDCRIEPILQEQIEAIDFKLYDAILISDYDKGFLRLTDMTQIVARCNGLPVFVDTKKTNLSTIDLDNVFIKINDAERRALDHIPQHAHLIVTLGGTGAQYKGRIFPAFSCPVFDVCGAGDTFLVGLAFAYLYLDDLNQAIDFANRCASIAVQHVGTYAVKPSDF